MPLCEQAAVASACSVVKCVRRGALVVQGRPVYIQQLGQVNVTQLKKVTTEDRMLKFHIQEYERCVKVIMPICSHIRQKQIDQTFGIMDVRGECDVLHETRHLQYSIRWQA